MFTKPDAIKVVCNASKIYHKKLANKNFLVLYKNRSNNAVESFEALFLPRNFLHLTGLTYINPKNSSDFYRKCLSNNLSEDDFTFKEDGTTDLKLKALPQIVNFFQMSKMTTLYSNTQPRLYTERLAGNVTACVGFIVDDNNGYYVPNTCLLQDIRTVSGSLHKYKSQINSFSSSVRLAKAICSLFRSSQAFVSFILLLTHFWEANRPLISSAAAA